MTEAELLEELNTAKGWELESTCKDTWCRWDAESDEYLVELKCRRAHYDTQLIEKPKFLHCIAEAHKTGKDFLYVANTPEGTYIFNVSELNKQDYDFKWETKRLPSKTMFGKWEYVDKKVGYIDVSHALS